MNEKKDDCCKKKERAKGSIFVSIALLSIAIALGTLAITNLVYIFG